MRGNIQTIHTDNIILILAVISFLLEKIPVNMTVMLTGALVLTGLVTPKEAVSGFASSTISDVNQRSDCQLLLKAGYVTKVLRGFNLKYSKTERQMIMAIMIPYPRLCRPLSNSGTVAIFSPIIIGITATNRFSRSKLLMSAFLGAMASAAGERWSAMRRVNVLIGIQIKRTGTAVWIL